MPFPGRFETGTLPFELLAGLQGTLRYLEEVGVLSRPCSRHRPARTTATAALGWWQRRRPRARTSLPS